MAPASDDKLRVTVAKKALRFDKRGRMPVTVDVLAQQGISTDDRGRAKDIIAEMAEDDSAPIRWVNKSIDLVAMRDLPDDEKEGMVRSWILRYGSEDDLPWYL